MNQNNNKKQQLARRQPRPQVFQGKSGLQVRQNPPVNRLVSRDQRISLERLVLGQLARQPQLRQRRENVPFQRPSNGLRDKSQLGAVVRTRLSKLGFSDIRGHRETWVIGYTYVGDGTNGTLNSVYFLPFSAGNRTWLIQGLNVNGNGMVPILAADNDLGALYIQDVEKHYARKVIKRMWIHVDSLQPSTSNNMMCEIAPYRGPGGAAYSIPITYATAAVTANSVGNVSSMKGAFSVDSWESKTCEITDYIAGGSGPRQNEFEIQGTLAGPSIYTTSTVKTTGDYDAQVPACFAVAGNSTTAALAGTLVHQISIEQEVDLLDFVGGMSDFKLAS